MPAEGAMLGVFGAVKGVGGRIASVFANKAGAGAAKAAETVFKTSHYAPRLEAAGVNVARAESAVAKEVATMRGSMSSNADVVGRLHIDGVLVEYRARLLSNGSVNIGTLFPVK